MGFRRGQRVVCVLDGAHFVAFPFGVPAGAMGLAEPENGEVYVIELIAEAWLGRCLKLEGLAGLWDVTAFRPAVDSAFEALVEIARDPRKRQSAVGSRQSPAERNRLLTVEFVPDADGLLPPLRTPALPDLLPGGAGEPALIRRREIEIAGDVSPRAASPAVASPEARSPPPPWSTPPPAVVRGPGPRRAAGGVRREGPHPPRQEARVLLPQAGEGGAL